jgi:hypothetical protein
MPLHCRICQRVNPDDALFCHHDGVALDGARSHGGPIAVGARAFPMPFVFPSGRTCHSFDELAIACDTLWDEARDMLTQGFLGGFLAGVGRADLAGAARQAARNPDVDRGLDELLDKLPSAARIPARLFAEPTDLSLGRLTRAQPYHFKLHLENQGGGLLHGSITPVNTPWLALGDAHSAGPKLFQCRHDLDVPVHVVPHALRAGDRPLEGRLVIESSGGSAAVVIRAECPIVPFPEGALAGARTPRQLAEKAHKSPRDAAALFEKGAVAAWYENNGWTYPVQGPSTHGLGAVQQYFEALGLVTPPKVVVTPLSVELRGAPGASLEASLTVATGEKRPVWAAAVSGAPWLHAGKARLSGRSARIPLSVPSVPALPGETLRGAVQVTANGNQQFRVEVTLAISGTPGAGHGNNGAPDRVQVLDIRQALATPAGGGEVPWFLSAGAAAAPAPPPRQASPTSVPRPAPPMELPPRPARASVGTPLVEVVTPARAAPAPVPVPAPVPAPVVPQRAQSTMKMPAPVPAPTYAPAPPAEAPPGDWLKHLIAPGVIALLLLGVLLHDLVLKDKPEPEPFQFVGGPGEGGVVLAPVDPDPYLAAYFHDEPLPKAVTDREPTLAQPTMRFGLTVVRGDERDRGKRLTFSHIGITSNACLRVDGREVLFGSPKVSGAPRWVGDMAQPLGKDAQGRDRVGTRSVWLLNEYGVQVTQEVEVVPSDLLPGEKKRRLDTCLVTYTIENKDSQPHKVGLRFLLDTYIGGNDGVPFAIPGADKLIDTQADLRENKVPDFIQAQEHNDVERPGTVAKVQFRVGKKLEVPGRVTLGGWPDSGLKRHPKRPQPKADGLATKWDVPVVDIRELHDSGLFLLEDGKQKKPPPDSAVTMYWYDDDLATGQKRTVGFAYGLGRVSISEGGTGGSKLALTVGGRQVKKEELTVVALVQNPSEGEKLTLELSEGLKLVGGGDETQAVPPVPAEAARKVSPVTWKVKADQPGDYTIEVRSSKGPVVRQSVTIRDKGLYD